MKSTEWLLPTLLYRAETWAVKEENVRKLRSFHNCCITAMLGVSRLQQWEERITPIELAKRCGMSEHMYGTLRKHIDSDGWDT